MNHTKRFSSVTRRMNKYMGIIAQTEKEHIRVDYRTAIQRKGGVGGLV